MSILHDIKPVFHYGAAAAAQTAVEPTNGVDTHGFGGIAFLVAIGAVDSGSVTTIYAEMSSDDGVGDGWEEIKSTSIVVPDDGDDSLYFLDINHPAERYVRCVVTRATADSALTSVMAILYDPRTKPCALAANTAALLPIAEGIAGAK
jgi:hypothetical protein